MNYFFRTPSLSCKILLGLLVTCVLQLAHCSNAKAQKTVPITGIDAGGDVIDHARFDSLWRASKSFGRLSTGGVDSEAYRSYRELLSNANPSAHLPNSRVAFWVNAYLACLMETIHNRVGYRTTVWDSLFLERDTFLIANEKLTLIGMQTKILENARTVRARAFLTTGSSTGPPFPAHALFAKTVDKELRGQLRKLVRNEKYVLYDPAGNVLQLSTLFHSWTADMEAEAGSVVDFIIPWVRESTAAQLALGRSSMKILISDRIERWRKRY